MQIRSMEIVLDTYARKARLQPALLTALPLGLAALAWFPEGSTNWSIVWGLFIWCGGATLLTQIGRDRGKRIESRLYESWGGKPTTRFLRHCDAPNKTALARHHKKLQTLLQDIEIPTAEREHLDINRADDTYEACVAFLREKTRDRKRFPLIFEENCNYGFRRNLLGMRAIGISVAIIGVIFTTFQIAYTYFIKGNMIHPIPVICGILSLLLLLGWIFWFTPDWVKIAAEAYAERLLASCDDL